MKRLSLEELKAQAPTNISDSLEAVKGGTMGDCHGLISQAAEQWRISTSWITFDAFREALRGWGESAGVGPGYNP